MSIPLLSTVAVDTISCRCFPYFPVISPFSTGQGSFPLLLMKFLESALASGVRVNLFFVFLIVAEISFSIALRIANAIFWTIRFHFKS